jgi:LPXTG-motif cell wall-anchored protein
MIVVSRMRGVGSVQIDAPYSRSMIFPPNRARVASAMRASGGWTQTQRLNGLRGRGLGALAVPTWAPWLAGGLAVGGAAGYFFFRKKRK